MFKLDFSVNELIAPFFQRVGDAVVALFERRPARIGVSVVFLALAGLELGGVPIATAVSQ